MNQQIQGSAFLNPSDVPLRRKRGRPRKEEIALLGENMPVMPASDSVMNSKQTAGTADDCDDQMVGQVVTGVIEGVFDAGYLLNVQVADTDTYLRGAVFLPGRVAPITAENDVAPHVRMVKRKEIPIPVLTPQTQVFKSVPPSGQCSKQLVESESPVPNCQDQVPPTELHTGISVSVENQFASIIEPMADLPKNDTSIATGGIPQRLCSKQPVESEFSVPKSDDQVPPTELHSGISVSVENQFGSIIEPMADLPKNDTSIAIGGIPQRLCGKKPVESESSEPDSEDQVPPTELHSGITVSVENQFPSIMEPMADLPKNDTSIAAGGIPERLSEPGHKNQSASVLSELECDKIAKQDETLHELDSSRQVKELIADGTVKDSQPASEPMNIVPSIENTDKVPTTGQQTVTAVDKLNKLIHEEPKTLDIELNKSPVSAEPKPVPSEPTSKSVDNSVEKQASPKADIPPETNSKVAFDTSSKVDTSNSNGTKCTGVVIFDVGSNPALETSFPSVLFDGEAVISEPKFLSEGSVFPERSDPQNLSSSGAITQVNAIQPIESLANSVESENPIGADNS